MGEISQISVGDETYEIKDSVAREKLDEVCVNTLHILFCDPLGGQTYSVTGGGESYEGKIPNSSLAVDLSLLGHDTKYTVKVEYKDTVYEESVTTGPYFDHYNLVFMPFDVASWRAISLASASGDASSYWAIGDRKAVNLSGTIGILDLDGTYYAYIIGFDHNAALEGTHRVHMQFGFDEDGNHIAFVDDEYNSNSTTAGFRMNKSNTNSGGWESSYMRNTVCDMLEAILSNAIGTNYLNTITKYTDNTGGDIATLSEVTPTTETVFLLSEYEIFGSNYSILYANPYEKYRQEQYEYYSSGNSKKMQGHTSANNSTCKWWTRSPYSANSSDFCYIYTSVNAASHDVAYLSAGFAPAFTI